MAFTLSPNLKLRIDSNLTANAKYNLNRLDLLGSTFLVDTTDSLRIRSQTDISIEPNSADIGGSGIGGSLSIGNADHKLESLQFWADELLVSDPLSLFDQASGGSKYLKLQYKSDLNGSVDTTADRSLLVDLEGADRELVLGGNYSQLGGNLVLNLTADSNLILPTTGTLATLAGVEVFTNKTIDVDGPNTISNLRNVNLAANAAVVYSKLALTNSIVNADVNSAAAVAYSKLNLASSIQNSDIVPAAGIPYSKLTLTNSILNADIVAGAGIPYTKLDLAGYIVNNDIAFGAAIAGTKVDPDFGSQDVQTEGSLILSNGTGTSSFQAAGSQAGNIPYILPITTPNASQVLAANIGNPLQLEWSDIPGTGTVTSVDFAVPTGFTISGNPITTAGTLTLGLSAQSPNTFWAGPVSGGMVAPLFRPLSFLDMPTGIPAANIANGAVSDVEFQYLNGVTSAIQTQLNSKEPTQTKGTISTSTTGVTVGSGSNSTVGPNVTVDVQTASGSQPGLLSSMDWSSFNSKQAAGNYITALTGDVTASGPGSSVATIAAGAVDNSKVSNSAAIDATKIADGSVSNTEFQYLDGVTSAIQTQLGGKASTALSNLTVSSLAVGSLLLGSSSSAVSNLAIGSSGFVLTSNGTTASWASPSISSFSFKTNWLNATGTTKVVTHNLGSTDVLVQLFDNSTGATIEVDSVVRTDTNTVTLTSSTAPAVSWRVLILAI